MAASPVGLFVTHLRLLDLDRRDDWPGLSVSTFSARAADQKQRIAGTEWALFRLFELWDAPDAARRLRPFFPPLEPLQSLNLRQALFRWLSELKKSGVLGRESLLRKTMLDECKGDKLFELLAVFAAVVLRKLLAARVPTSLTSSAVARRLATAPTLPSHELPSLLPLALAHRDALTRLLRRKDEKRARFAHLAATLDAKTSDIRTRTRRCIDTPRALRPPVAPRDAAALKRQLADNWIGDQKWLAVMLHGDHVHPADAFLTSRFDKVWHTIERGRALQDAGPETGLLEDLQSRVHDQQARLHKWKTFHDELRRHNTKDAPVTSKQSSTPAAATTTALTFDAHLQHQLPSKHTEHAVQRAPLRSTYRDILADMHADLSRVSQSKPQPALTSLRRRRSSASAPRSPLRTRPAHPPSPKQTKPSPKQTKPSPEQTKASPKQIKPSLPWHTEPKTLLNEPKMLVREQKALFEGLSAASSNLHLRPAKPTHSTHSTHSPTRRPFHRDPPLARTASSSSLPSEDSAPSQPTPHSDHSLPYLETSDLLADQIISAIDNATPSPVKRPQPRMSMSLIDRTRMTLSRTPSFDPVVESLPPPPASPPPADTSTTQTLLDRTRQSMASVSRAPSLRTKHTRPKPHRKPSDTHSLDTLDTLDEILPQGATTPREDLLAAADDYDRVFKSRPKIATSPVFSPSYGDTDLDVDQDQDDDVTGIDLADVDASDDEAFAVGADSPSKGRTGRW